MKSSLTLNQLTLQIRETDHNIVSLATRAINKSLTIRNWLIGYYIHTYELRGADRSNYGENVLGILEKKLSDLSNCSQRQLYRYIKFYLTYPSILGTLSPEFLKPDSLLDELSYSQFELIIEIEDTSKRSFYENESIRGNWSVRELKRQIDSMYYERTLLSKSKNKLVKLNSKNIITKTFSSTIKDPYIFEFLGLKSKDVMGESHLEDQLIDKLENFLLELGHGFCFEARQKRIVIGSEHFFIDLVFYHRILKCHVLVEIKLSSFNHENIGQLNTYVSWYKKNMVEKGDNPPIGILLCTTKNTALAEYALAGMDNNLFVSKYQLELPKKEEMQSFLQDQVKKMGLHIPKKSRPKVKRNLKNK